MSAEVGLLERVRALLNTITGAVGAEGDASSMGGSVHGKLEAIYAKPFGLRCAGTGPYPTGAANVFGAWRQMTAAAAQDLICYGLSIETPVLPGSDQPVRSYVEFQVGVGGAGAEVPVGATRVGLTCADTNHQGTVGLGLVALPAPILLPNAARVSVRACSDQAAAVIPTVLMVANRADLVGL
jgi:hypothetical protein